MEDVLRSRGLFRITSGKETEPTDDDKKIKWANRCDEARGFEKSTMVSSFFLLRTPNSVI